MGNHNILNILAAFSSVYQLNGDMNFFLKSLKSFKNESQRLEFQPWINQSNLINDSYNANPDSVKAAIDVLHQMRGRKNYDTRRYERTWKVQKEISQGDWRVCENQEYRLVLRLWRPC